MKIIRNNKIILENVDVAKSLWKQGIGLMFQGNPQALLMVFKEEKKPGIWMFGMRFPIDLVFISSKKKVIDIKENIKPINFNPKTWKTYYPKEASKYILELPAGTVKKEKIRIGTELRFESS